MTEKYLDDKGTLANVTSDEKRSAIWVTMIAVTTILVFVILLASNTIAIDPIQIANYSAVVIIICAILYFVYLIFFADVTSAERKNIITIAIYFATSIIFYMGYEQQGSTLNLFAKRYTDMFIGTFEMPASWLQAVPAVAVILFAPAAAWLWIWLSRRDANPHTEVKLSYGLVFVGLSYLVMAGAALFLANGQKPLPTWLIVTYLFHTFGEICLYPVGLSAVTKLAPKKYSGQMMGVWFLSLSLGNLLAGLVAGQMTESAIAADPMILVHLFLLISVVLLVAGGGVYLLKKPLRKLHTS